MSVNLLELACLFHQVVGDDTPVIEAVLQCDVERSSLLQEEAALLKKLNREKGGAAAGGDKAPTDPAEAAMSTRLTQVRAPTH